MRRVKQGHGLRADIEQLDETIAARSRVVMNFAEDHRPHPRPGVGRAQAQLALRRKHLLPHTIDLAAEGDPRAAARTAPRDCTPSGSSAHLLKTGKHLSPTAGSRKTTRCARNCIELVLVQPEVGARGQMRSIRETELARL